LTLHRIKGTEKKKSPKIISKPQNKKSKILRPTVH